MIYIVIFINSLLQIEHFAHDISTTILIVWYFGGQSQREINPLYISQSMKRMSHLYTGHFINLITIYFVGFQFNEKDCIFGTVAIVITAFDSLTLCTV